MKLVLPILLLSLVLFSTVAFTPLQEANRRRISPLQISTLRAYSSNDVIVERTTSSHSKRQQQGFSSFAMSLAMVATLTLSTPAMAAESPFILNHDYADPLHPSCLRKIEVNRDGTSFHYSGTAVGPKDDPVLRGCTPAEIKEFGIRRGAFDGEISGPGPKISAGDGIHEGVWEPAKTATTNIGYEDVDGVRWNDGNKWIVKEKPVATAVGEWIFYAYIGFSTLAGVKGVFDGIQRKRQETPNI
jgi:hypothetical protein